MSTDSENMDALRDKIEAYVSLAEDYRANPELRARTESDPAGVLAERGVELPAGVDLRMVVDTAETVHIVLPPDPNAELADEALDSVAAGCCLFLIGWDPLSWGVMLEGSQGNQG